MDDKRRTTLTQTLAAIEDPISGASWGALKVLSALDARRDGEVDIQLCFPYSTSGLEVQIEQQLCEALQPTGLTWRLTLGSRIQARQIIAGTQPIPDVANVIAVASGKGGVGKSTTAVHLAVALANQGVKVGVLDADIYGPNVPAMLGLGQARAKDARPPYAVHRAHGVVCMSIAFLVDTATPMVWRGPMASRALTQLARDTTWPALDVLLVDLPPGTGDIPLTLSQKLPVAGAVVVTTPQNVALLDARKGIAMFNKVNVPVLGVVENMAYHVCAQCGHHAYLFGQDGGAALAASEAVPLLGSIPLQQRLREGADAGDPITSGAVGQAYCLAARRMLAQLALRPRSYAAKFPPIVVEQRGQQGASDAD